MASAESASGQLVSTAKAAALPQHSMECGSAAPAFAPPRSLTEADDYRTPINMASAESASGQLVSTAKAAALPQHSMECGSAAPAFAPPRSLIEPDDYCTPINMASSESAIG